MNKLTLPIALLFLISFAASCLAQGTELPKPGLTPDNPFYFLERISEGIGTFFTFGDLKKAERYAVLAAERVAEAQAVVEKGKLEFAEKTLERYERQLNQSIARAEKAQAKGKSVKKVIEIVAEGTGKHLTVIEGILEKVSEKAKEAAIKAKEASMDGQKNALRALAKEDPEGATEINLKAAEARLNRAKVKAEEGETDEAEEAVKEFEGQYKFGEEISQIAQGLGKDMTTVEQLVGKATSIHLEILAEVYEKAPEEAKPAIEKAMEVSVRGHSRIVEILKEKEALDKVPEEAPIPEKLPEKAKEKLKVEKSITVISPNGGEKWDQGSTYNITWSSAGIDKVNLYLIDEAQEIVGCTSGTPDYTCTNWKLIASKISASPGTYSWEVPSDQTVGSKYRIKIREIMDVYTYQTIFLSDQSDNYFSVVSVCQNECSQTGLKGCSNNSYQVCGNYDADKCLEWGPITSCQKETSCLRGDCIAINPPKPGVEYWGVLIDSPVSGEIETGHGYILLKDMLRRKGWQEDHIKYLIEENATYSNVISALDWLAVNSDSNDIVLFSVSAHGSPVGFGLVDRNLYYSELAEKFDKISYGGFAIMLGSCQADYAIPYLEKENRIILLSVQHTAERSLRTLTGFGDIEGNNDNWVSIEEIFNSLEYPEDFIGIQDDYAGELNIAFQNSYLRYLDQYNMYKSPIGGLPVGARIENEISWLAQSFKPDYPVLTKVMLDLYRQNNPGPLTVSIRKDLSGSDLTSVTLPQDTFYYAGKHKSLFSQPYEFDFPDIQVIPGETYYIVVGAPQAVQTVWEEAGWNQNLYGFTHNENYYPKGKLFTFYNPRLWGPAGVWSPAEDDVYFAVPKELDLFFATFGKPK